MVLRVGIRRGLQENIGTFAARFTHAFALPPSSSISIHPPFSSPTLTLPENEDFPGFTPGAGSMDLMAVPKKKVSRHKKAIRNGPKALKPTPVIIRCKSCGRVKLPHFYCCSGRREDPGERSDATN